MGTGPSSLGGTLSREKLLKGTAVTREIVDIIFDFLMDNIKLRDFYSLSSPDRCRRYVLFTANQLYTKFIQFQIEPTKGKDGTIMFRSVSDLTEPPKAPIGSDPTKDEGLQQQRLCLQLAYFYVRIFQIYGALALTLVDDSKFMAEHGYTRSFFRGEAIRPPGEQEYATYGPLRHYDLGPARRVIGGGLYNKEKYERIPIYDIRSLDLFQCLWSVLYVPKVRIGDSRRDKTYIMKFEGNKEGGPGAILTIDSGIERTDTKRTQKARIILESGEQNKAILYLTAESEPSTGGYTEKIVLKFDTDITLRIGGKEVREYGALDDIVHRFAVLFKGAKTFDTVELPIWEVYIDRVDYTVDSVIRGLIEKVWNKIKTIIKPSLLDKDSKFTKKEYVTEATPSKWTEEKDVIQHLKIQPIVDGMTRKRRFGHCIGRALQLLTSIPSLSGARDLSSKATSSICDLKFSKDYVDTPTGIALSETASISSLANLFYDTITAGYPKPDLIMDANGLSEYIKMIKQFSEVFMDKQMSDADIGQAPGEALKRIRTSESVACSKEDGKLVIDNDFAMKFVYPHVQELFRIQLVHASQCAKIFVQLFDIRREKEQYRVRIHPNVIARGINEVNRIAKITRNILIAYYTNCETVYTKGVMNIENALKSKDPRVRFDEKEKQSKRPEDEGDKKTMGFERAGKEGDFLKSVYRPEDIEKYRREQRRGYYDDRDYNRDRFRYGGRLTMTRKRKSK